ncbi:sialin-like isoform X1 [Euwallacea fornicatus]|uniref:sialin-like isoform X1 n=2 Tax=Euwallacea fornicatus TaxID=995702 RepID=UPI00338F98B3
MGSCKTCCQNIPTRYIIMAMIFFTTFINYTTRTNMSVSLPAMVLSGTTSQVAECETDEVKSSTNTTTKSKSEEVTGTKYEWNQAVQGLILGAYFYGYLMCSLPGGLVAEWVGPYLTIILATALSGVLNSLGVWLTSLHWGALFGTRFFIGACGAFIYPALQCVVGRWAPPQERSKFLACLMGNNLGTCWTWMVGGIVTQYYKWPWGFHVMSFQIVIFCIVFGLLMFDSPEQHPWITDEELKYIKESQEGTVSRTKSIPPYKAIFKSFAFWTLCVLHFGNLWGLYVQITAVPKFMKEYIGFDIKNSGILSSLPHLVRVFMGLGFGFLGDYLKRQFRRILIIKSFIVLSHIIPGILLGIIGLAKCNTTVVVTLLTLSMSINGATVVTNLAIPTDLSPNFAGTIFGIISFIGGTTGFIVPSVTGALITKFGNNSIAWRTVFALGGIMYCSCGLFFILFGTADIQPWNEKRRTEEES